MIQKILASEVLTTKFVIKLILTFFFTILMAGIGYTITSIYFSNQYFYQTTQRLNAGIAKDLIKEKFVENHPLDSTGAVNKPLFSDIMNNMMAVNRAIEVYLLDAEGHVKYSVVLDHKVPDTQQLKIDLEPIHRFINSDGKEYVLGDDPKDLEKRTIFSAAKFNHQGYEGYMYIVLAGNDFLATRSDLFNGYLMHIGLGGSLLTLFFATALGIIAIWHLTKSLREIIFAAKRFQQGDLKYRIDNADQMDLANVATTYNDMADTILADIEKIKSIDQLRKELIANVSHDLRTPLAIIQGYTDTLHMKNTELSKEEQLGYLNVISSGSTRLAKLITQLFEYSKLESNQVRPEKEPFLISELANDIYRDYAILAMEKNIDLKLSMSDDIPLVFADISLVERAIQNLMDNAVKFTPENGKITINITTLTTHVEVMIKDTGPGIEKENQALIFERYKQTKAGQEKEGSGLGLAIVKKIMEIHNSHISVRNNPNEGTVFSFALPIHKPV